MRWSNIVTRYVRRYVASLFTFGKIGAWCAKRLPTPDVDYEVLYYEVYMNQISSKLFSDNFVETNFVPFENNFAGLGVGDWMPL